MATTINNVTYTELVNATFRANNSSDTTGPYTISADVQVSGSSVTSVTNGVLTYRVGSGSASFWADASNSHFDLYGISTTTDQVAVVEAILEFINSAKTSAPANVDPANL